VRCRELAECPGLSRADGSRNLVHRLEANHVRVGVVGPERAGIQTPKNSSVGAMDQRIPTRRFEVVWGRAYRDDCRLYEIT
jgi:hypothetical protein